MEYIITNTTDKHFIGKTLKYSGEKVIIIDNNVINVEKILQINEKELRLANSNYSIDLREV